MANFNFFGDSWYWTWNLGPRAKGHQEPPYIRSKQLIDLNKISLYNFLAYEHTWNHGHSLYDIYLKH